MELDKCTLEEKNLILAYKYGFIDCFEFLERWRQLN